jgi:hypothetical protein
VKPGRSSSGSRPGVNVMTVILGDLSRFPAKKLVFLLRKTKQYHDPFFAKNDNFCPNFLMVKILHNINQSHRAVFKTKLCYGIVET